MLEYIYAVHLYLFIKFVIFIFYCIKFFILYYFIYQKLALAEK